MDCNSVNTLLSRYESVFSAKMTKSLGKSIINLSSNIACSVLGIGNQQELSTDFVLSLWCFVRPGFHYTTNATTTTQKQSDYKVEQSSFTLIALF